MFWPDDCDRAALDQSLKIALEYLQLTGQAQDYRYTEQVVATAIIRSWRAGTRHPIRLANDGIAAIESKKAAARTDNPTNVSSPMFNK
jgi:hypothetical protein